MFAMIDHDHMQDIESLLANAGVEYMLHNRFRLQTKRQTLEGFADSLPLRLDVAFIFPCGGI
jgi:hypothetical protein